MKEQSGKGEDEDNSKDAKKGAEMEDEEKQEDDMMVDKED